MTSERDSTDVGRAAKHSFEASQSLDATERVKALQTIREELKIRQPEILAANQRDLQECHVFLMSRMFL